MRTGAWLAAALAALIGWGSAALAQTIRWDLTNEYQPNSLPGQGDTFFAERVRELTGGRLVITPHFSGALGYKSQAVLDAVGQGAVQLGDASSIFWGGINPIFQISGLPFLTRGPDDSRALFESAKPYLDKVFEKNNQRLLFSTPWPPSGIWSRKPLAGPKDLEGLKIRTYDTASTQTFRALKAAPQQLAWADVIPQLGTGGIDAVLTSADGGASAKFWEHLSQFAAVDYAMPISMATVNLDAFKGLPKDLQDAVLKAAEETQERQWKALAERVRQNYTEMRQHKVTIVEKPAPELVKALSDAGKPLLDEWLQRMGADGAAILAEYRRRVPAN